MTKRSHLDGLLIGNASPQLFGHTDSSAALSTVISPDPTGTHSPFASTGQMLTAESAFTVLANLLALIGLPSVTFHPTALKCSCRL